MTESTERERAELRGLAASFAAPPTPGRGEVVPATALHEFARRVLPYLAAAEGSE
jgi:hypothetical protein